MFSLDFFGFSIKSGEKFPCVLNQFRCVCRNSNREKTPNYKNKLPPSGVFPNKLVSFLVGVTLWNSGLLDSRGDDVRVASQSVPSYTILTDPPFVIYILFYRDKNTKWLISLEKKTSPHELLS